MTGAGAGVGAGSGGVGVLLLRGVGELFEILWGLVGGLWWVFPGGSWWIWVERVVGCVMVLSVTYRELKGVAGSTASR